MSALSARRRATTHAATGTGATLALATIALAGTAPAAEAADYTVREGDTVTAIARRAGTTVSRVAADNALADPSSIRAGQVLRLPDDAAAAAPVTAPPATAAPAPTGTTYTVRSGDTVSAIAARHGTTVAAVLTANGLDQRAFIRAGQTLTVPGGAQPTTALVGDTFAGRTYAPEVVGAANQNKATLLSVGVPSRDAMRAKVVATAQSLGVDAALAQAVAFQESGFDQAAVSPANAIGTMQVIPSSGEWASQLVGRRLDLLSPDDNVLAGVAILRSLVRTSPDLPTAIASYYQGAASVRTNGMFADTRRYVANVQTLMTRFG